MSAPSASPATPALVEHVVIHDLEQEGQAGVEQQLRDISRCLGIPALHGLYGSPSSLLPVAGVPALAHLFEGLRALALWPNTYLLTSPEKYKSYERWALGAGFPAEHVLTAGKSARLPFGVQMASALELLVSRGMVPSSPVLCLSATFLYDAAFWAFQLPHLFHAQPGNWLFQMPAPEFQAAPAAPAAPQPFPPIVHATIGALLQNQSGGKMKMSTAFTSIPHKPRGEDMVFHEWLLFSWMRRDFTVEEYARDFVGMRLERSAVPTTTAASTPARTESRAYARVGLAGNPSDGFHGKTLSVLISEFYATVWLVPNADPGDGTVTLLRNGLLDPYCFASLEGVAAVSAKDGYYGAHRLLWATLTTFLTHCRDVAHLPLPPRPGFSIAYDTCIPRQVGLAGSSALVTALLKALVKYYGIPVSALPLWRQANLALAVERQELGISSGYQDRVIQAYGGLMFMDLAEEFMQAQGHGRYEELPLNLLPSDMWIGRPVLEGYMAKPIVI